MSRSALSISSEEAALHGALVTEVKGHWAAGPLTTVSYDPQTGEVVATGGDTFTGTFTGTSAYTITGRLLPDGSFVGFSDETITATATDGTSGTITEQHQPFHFDAQGNFSERSPITSGTGDWAGSTGLLIYEGFVDPFGDSPEQGGEYSGIWVRPVR